MADRGLYKHFKGRMYQVLGNAFHSETREAMVVYQALYPPFETFVRPAAMFDDNVSINGYGETGPRFKFIREI